MRMLFSATMISYFIYLFSGPSYAAMTLEQSLSGAHRSADNKKRDKFRNPKKTLEFFEVKPDMSVVEISPGTGWYTEILAPYIKSTLYLAAFDDQSTVEYFKNANAKLKAKVDQHKKQFGNVEYTVMQLPNKIGPIAPANSVDRVLTFRNVHNWMKAGKAQEVFNEFARVLKKGGVLGIVEHRANPKSPKDPKAENGYVHTEQVMEFAKKAGLTFVASSEINANPKDTADHPKGVWTLPPD